MFQIGYFVKSLIHFKGKLIKVSPQISSLWKVANAVFDIIWTARNKRVFEGLSTSFFSTKASIWAIVRDTNKYDTGTIQTAWTTGLEFKDWE